MSTAFFGSAVLTWWRLANLGLAITASLVLVNCKNKEGFVGGAGTQQAAERAQTGQQLPQDSVEDRVQSEDLSPEDSAPMDWQEQPTEKVFAQPEESLNRVSDRVAEQVQEESFRLLRETFEGKTLPTVPVDVVFVVDTSISMEEEKARLEQQLPSFVERLSSRKLNLDIQVVLIGKGLGGGISRLQTATAALLDQEVGSRDGLRVLKEFIDSGGRAGSLRLRKEAVLEAVFVTDQDAERGDESDFRNFVAGERDPGMLKVNGLVVLPSSQRSDSCSFFEAGRAYISLSKDRDYGGVALDICSQNWDELFRSLADNVAKNDRSRRFGLGAKAIKKSDIEVLIDDEKLPSSGFSMNNQSGKTVVTLNDQPPSEAEVVITYKARLKSSSE